MRRTSQITRISALLTALATVTVSAASCSSAVQATGRTHPSSCRAATMRPAPGPVPGSRCLAEQISRRMLREVLPPAARMTVSGALPAEHSYPHNPTAVDNLSRHAIFVVPRSAGWVVGYLHRLVLAGMLWTGGGQIGGPTGYHELDWTLRRLPAGLSVAMLDVRVLAVGTTARMRVETEVEWYPPRSRGEYIRPDRFKAARLAETVFNHPNRTFQRTVTSRAIIARLASTLNVLHGNGALAGNNCAAVLADYQITFVPTAGRESVTAVPDGCGSVNMYVGNMPQPGLLGGWTTMALITRLTGADHHGRPYH